MRRAARHLLCRFPLLQTRALSAARDVTSRFWPKHTSVVLGPDDYALEMNRVLLGHVAVTFVACTSRIRAVSAAATTEYALYVPFEGDIHLVADGADLSASPDRPLLRGPTRAFVFEPSPSRVSRCGIVWPAFPNRSVISRHGSWATPSSRPRPMLASGEGATWSR